MLNAIYRIFFNRTVLTLVGLLALSLLIWFAGPLFAFADYRPLEPEAVRGWLILGVFAFWLAKLLFRWWFAANMNGRMINRIARMQAGSAEKEEAPGAAQVAELEQRFREALGILKKVRFGDRQKSGWLNRFSQKHLYQLPWYVIIGAPGTGKTTALINSGLDFPLADQFGKAAIKGIGGTRNCDWWFTNEAVLIDTAGRYTTQESNETLDKAEWTGFLALLKRFRRRQPINGVMLTLSITDLLTCSQDERQIMYARIRARLAELCEHLSIRFPVYLLITKADQLAGFNPYFVSLGKEQRAQVWGVTFPYNEGAGGLRQFKELYRNEFDLLRQQINLQMPEKLLGEQDLTRRATMYSLPQQFAGLRDLLDDAVQAIFADSKFEEKPLLRGLYFTSGTQDGMAFDRVLSALHRNFGVDAPVVTRDSPASGKSYFIERLFKEVIFPESGLTGRNLPWERKLKLMRQAGFAAVVGLLAGALFAFTVSHENNRAYLHEIAAKAERLSEVLSQTGVGPEQAVLELLPLLDETRLLANSSRFDPDDVPLAYRYGLYQGTKVGEAARQLYHRLLEEMLLPRVASHVTLSLKSPFNAGPEYAYDALKAYLMLYSPEHYDPDYLRGWLLAEWERSLPASLSTGERQSLVAHLDALLGKRAVVPDTPKDDHLVLNTRQKLAALSPAQRAYSRLRHQMLNSTTLPEFTVISAAGPEFAPRVFYRASGKPLTRGVPGVFSYDGYHTVFNSELVKKTPQLLKEESWVLGEVVSSRQQATALTSGQLSSEIRRLYLQDYAKTWEEFLADVRPIAADSLPRAMEITRIQSSPGSPLAMFVKSVAKETTLSRPVEHNDQSLVDRAKMRAKTAQEDVQRITGSKINPAGILSNERLEWIVDNRFEAYRRLSSAPSNGGPAPIDASLRTLGELGTYLLSADQAIKSGGVPPPIDTVTRIRAEAGALPPIVAQSFDSLATTAAQKITASQRSNIGASLDTNIGQFCRRATLGRYPFMRTSNRDVTPDDFAKLFAQGGLMDEFFQRQLLPMVDTATTPWSFKRNIDGSPVAGSGSLEPFQQANTIRDVFFRNGARTPSLRIDIKPVELDSRINQITLDIDGQSLRYAHGPQVPTTVTWPGPRGSNQVRLQFSPALSSNNGLLTEGPWALHRLLDRAQITPGSVPERFTAVFVIDGRRAVFEFSASSIQNPFRLGAIDRFECPGKP